MKNLKSFKLFEQFNEEITKIELYKTGITVPKFCFGTNPFSRNKLTYVEGSNLLKYAYTKGLNFWDTSDDYETHLHISEALKEIPENDTIILSKITEIFEKEKVYNHVINMLYELSINSLDILLLHSVDSNDYYNKYMNIFNELTKTPVKNFGASSHNPEIVEKFAENDKIDVVMAPLNFKGEINIDDYHIENNNKYRDDMAQALKKCKENGKDTIAIKVFGKGEINEREKAIEFITNQDYIDVIDIGMESIQQIDENIELIKKYARI